MSKGTKSSRKITITKKKTEKMGEDITDILKRLPDEYTDNDEFIDEEEATAFQNNFITYDTKLTGNISKHEIDDLYRDMGMDVDKEVIEKIFKFIEKLKNPSYPDFFTALECFCFLRK